MMVARLIEQIREIEGRTVCVVFREPPLSQMSRAVRLSRPSEMKRLDRDRPGLSVHDLTLYGTIAVYVGESVEESLTVLRLLIIRTTLPSQ
jgi:hypothetical protein